jgi:predicted ribosomally synthesized peptide with nif11-like leader
MEVKMTTDSAQLFVQKMREDKGFRNTVQEISDRTELWEYIQNKGYAFDECDLVKAMAACMAELEAAG